MCSTSNSTYFCISWSYTTCNRFFCNYNIINNGQSIFLFFFFNFFFFFLFLLLYLYRSYFTNSFYCIICFYSFHCFLSINLLYVYIYFFIFIIVLFIYCFYCAFGFVFCFYICFYVIINSNAICSICCNRIFFYGF